MDCGRSAPGPAARLPASARRVMPFDFVDFDVKTADKPQKFYRVRQP